MRLYQRIGLAAAIVALLYSGVTAIFRSCNNYIINKPNLVSYSHPTEYFNPAGKCEYTRLRDNSEEILIREDDKILRFQNFDGDDTVDRIRIDKYVSRDLFRLEDILIRKIDYQNNKDLFNKADSILCNERNKVKSKF